MFSHMFLLFELLLLVFLQNCYLLISSRLSRLHGNPISCPISHTIGTQASMLYMHPHVSGTERVGFSKQDACGSLVVASLPVNFPFSTFCQRFLLQTSVGLITNHTKVDCCLSYDSFLVLHSRQ
jgi:hypothetical protein